MRFSYNIIMQLPDDFFNAINKILESFIDAKEISRGVNKLMSQHTAQLHEVTKNLNKLYAPFLEDTRKALQAFKGLHRAGLTPNLGEHRSIDKLKQYQKLLSMGYAIFWVPRAEVVDQLIAARTVEEKKKTIVNNRNAILQDCRIVVDDIDNKSLKDHKDQVLAALDALDSGNFRAAQSAANVCFDALFDHLVDESTMKRFDEVTRSIHNSGEKLKSFDRIPIPYLYAALQTELIAVALRKFNRLKPQTVHTKYARNSSTHSVSSRQFTEHNALQVVMITCSLLATTNKLGRNWMTNLTKYV